MRFRILGLLLILAALAAAAVALPRMGTPTFNGTDLGEAGPPRDFTLQAADRGSVSLSEFRSRVVLLFFGYTSCPDACPLTMARLRQVVESLGPDREDVQVLLVSVDPDVDTPERLQEYVTGFDPAFIGLGGKRAELAEVARSFGAWGGEPEEGGAAPDGVGPEHPGHGLSGRSTTARIIPHTPHVFGIDREGRFRVLWSPDLEVAQIAEDVRTLLRL